MFCEKCGRELRREDKFCPRCGWEFGKEATEEKAEKSLSRQEEFLVSRSKIKEDRVLNAGSFVVPVGLLILGFILYHIGFVPEFVGESGDPADIRIFWFEIGGPIFVAAIVTSIGIKHGGEAVFAIIKICAELGGTITFILCFIGTKFIIKDSIGIFFCVLASFFVALVGAFICAAAKAVSTIFSGDLF